MMTDEPSGTALHRLVIVFDTNVVITLSIGASRATHLFARLRAGGHRVAVSPQILAEVGEKMRTRPVPQVPPAASRSIPCGRLGPHPARTRGAHTASRSGTSGSLPDRPDARGPSSSVTLHKASAPNILPQC